MFPLLTLWLWRYASPLATSKATRIPLPGPPAGSRHSCKIIRKRAFTLIALVSAPARFHKVHQHYQISHKKHWKHREYHFRWERNSTSCVRTVPVAVLWFSQSYHAQQLSRKFCLRILALYPNVFCPFLFWESASYRREAWQLVSKEGPNCEVRQP